MMKGAMSLILVFTGLALVLTMHKPAASASIGIYAIVEKVVFEPGDHDQQRVKIWGAFAVPKPNTSGQYKPAQRGYLYFTSVPDRDVTVKKEWADLRAVAGTGQAIGFAQYWIPTPNAPGGNPHRVLEVTVHKSSDAAQPAAYPLGTGVMKLGVAGSPPAILGQLRQALKAR
jgi:hypothetical protein